MAVSLLLAAMVPAAHASDEYPDVDDDHFFHDEISWVTDQGIAEGFDDGTYKPVRDVSRQAMVAFLHRIEGSPQGPFDDPGFKDVDRDHPFYTEISWAVETGVAQGFGDDTFRPTNPVSRQATSAFMYRLAGAPQLPGGEEWSNDFPDIDEDHMFHDEISWMASVGITEGFGDGEFKSTRSTTRQAMAAFIMRFINRPPPFANVAGTVTDADTEAPIEDATVVFDREGDDEFRGTTTDTAGEYSLERFVPDTYDVTVSADGYQSETRTVELDFGDNVEDFALSATPVAEPTGSITGTVDGSDQPDGINDALVIITDSSGDRDATITEADGSYEFLNVEPDTYEVSADAEGYESQTKETTVSAGEESVVDFTLQAEPSAIAGTVTDSGSGDAIEGAIVTLDDGDTTATGTDGSYSFDVAPGDHTVTADAEGYDAESQNVTVQRGETATADFALASQAQITTATLDSPDTGAQGATVSEGDEWLITFDEVMDTATTSAVIDLDAPGGASFTVECVDVAGGEAPADGNVAADCSYDDANDFRAIIQEDTPYFYDVEITDLVGLLTAEGGSVDVDGSTDRTIESAGAIT